MSFAYSLSKPPSPSREDEDLLERSVKKSKMGDGMQSGDMIDVVHESPLTEMEFENHENHGEKRDLEVRNKPQNQSKPSYSEMLAGMASQGQSGGLKDGLLSGDYPDSDDDVYEKEEDKDFCPLITLTKEEKKSLRQKWRQSLIIKVWGRRVGYNYLQKKLQSMWRPKAFMDLVALENDYYLVRFYSKDDFEYARDQGPWSILDHYLVVK